MKKGILYLVVLLLLVVSVIATDPVEVHTKVVKSQILRSETAFFILNVTNNFYDTTDISIKFPDSDWISRTVPLTLYRFSLEKGESKLVTVSFTPRDHIDYGSHTVPINVKVEESSKLLRINLPILLLRVSDREYVPVVRFDTDMDYEIDPRQDAVLKLNLENMNLRDLTNLTINIRSEVFNEERTIRLEPLEEKEETFTFSLDDTQAPLTDVLRVKVYTDFDNKTYSWEKTKEYKIIAYSNLEKNPRKEKSFLKTIEYIDVTNNGNVEKVFEVTKKITLLKRIFISTEPKSSFSIKSEDGRYIAWNVELNPDETKTIIVKESYRLLALILVLIILAVICYYVFRPPILIKKEVSHIGTSEGGISDIKVILYIKNRTSRLVEDITVIEKVPHIANIGKEFQVGTIKPTKVIQNPKKGTLVKWELQNLEAFEERIITYKIKSKLSILGGLTLPATIVKYMKRGKLHRTKSNRLILEI